MLERNKNSGFKRSDPTAPACKQDVPLYSQVAAPKTQAGHADHQQQGYQAPRQQETQQSRRPKVTIKYCHFYNNGTCHFEEKYGRKCRFSHEKAPTCAFDGKCNRNKCMFSHEKRPMNSNTNNFLGRKPQGNPLQAFIQQLLGSLPMSQEQTSQQGWQNRGWKRRAYH